MAVELRTPEGVGWMIERRISKSSEKRLRILEMVRSVFPRRFGRITTVFWIGGEHVSLQTHTGSAKM